jgi:hypothetical protein
MLTPSSPLTKKQALFVYVGNTGRPHVKLQVKYNQEQNTNSAQSELPKEENSYHPFIQASKDFCGYKEHS